MTPFPVTGLTRIHKTKYLLSYFCNRQRVRLFFPDEVKIICAEGSKAIYERNWCAILYHRLSLKIPEVKIITTLPNQNRINLTSFRREKTLGQ